MSDRPAEQHEHASQDDAKDDYGGIADGHFAHDGTAKVDGVIQNTGGMKEL